MLFSHSMLRIIIVMTIAFLMICAGSATGADNRFSLGPYVTITTGDGEPAHDIPRIGLQGRYLLNRDLYLTMSLDYTEIGP